MHHISFDATRCPIARGLDHAGERWSFLIMRDACHGFTRFDQFRKSLGIAPNILTRRLVRLVEAGLLERRTYSQRPPRHEYLLTQRGQDFQPVLWAILAWGNRHFAPEGESVSIVDTQTGKRAEPVLVDRDSGRILQMPAFTSAAGPAANDAVQRRHAAVAPRSAIAARHSREART